MRHLMNRLAVVLLSPYAGRHRGTPGQLMLQEAQRAERMTEWAQAIRRADLIANGSRSDWVMTEV